MINELPEKPNDIKSLHKCKPGKNKILSLVSFLDGEVKKYAAMVYDGNLQYVSAYRVSESFAKEIMTW